MKAIDTTFEYLKKEGYAGVTDFCRYLVSTGGKFENIEIHVYRDEMLCLVVKDIYVAATLEADGDHWRTYRKHGGKRKEEARG